MPIWAQAGLCALLGASSLMLGAALAYIFAFPKRFIAGIMALGCGVLISAVAYDLVLEGFEQGGFWLIAGGALLGSVVYTSANILVGRKGGKHRKRSSDKQIDAKAGGGLAIAIGSLLDGIPESLVLGVGMLDGKGVSLPLLAAIFLSNLPEGLSSASGMRSAGRSRTYVFCLWAAVVFLSSLAAMIGAALLGGVNPQLLAMVNAFAAGGLLTMIADTMIPEAVAEEHSGTGLLVVLGLLAAFSLSQAA